VGKQSPVASRSKGSLPNACFVALPPLKHADSYARNRSYVMCMLCSYLQNTYERGLGETHPPYPSSDVGCIGPYRVLDNTHSTL
jgi:hypothetical protein